MDGQQLFPKIEATMGDQTNSVVGPFTYTGNPVSGYTGSIGLTSGTWEITATLKYYDQSGNPIVFKYKTSNIFTKTVP